MMKTQLCRHKIAVNANGVGCPLCDADLYLCPDCYRGEAPRPNPECEKCGGSGFVGIWHKCGERAR